MDLALSDNHAKISEKQCEMIIKLSQYSNQDKEERNDNIKQVDRESDEELECELADEEFNDEHYVEPKQYELADELNSAGPYLLVGSSMK